MSKILVVDDETIVRKTVIAVLKMIGYETIEADNSISAIKMIKYINNV